MAMSPRSTVSSDLYSPSEPEQLKPHCNGDPPPIEDFRPSYVDDNDETEGSIFSDVMQGIDNTSDQNSRPSSAAGVPLLGSSPGISHKRKRTEYAQNGQEDYMTLDRREAQSSILQDSFGSISGGSSAWQDNEQKLDDPSKVKRPKPNGEALVSSQEAMSPYGFSGLPAALWQHVFCFVPPVSLGRLLRVNRIFQSCLTSNGFPENTAPLINSRIQPMNAEAIWVASRRRFAPGLPRPIYGMRELDMWKLLVGRNCQICANGADSSAVSESPWEAGPGNSGVRIIWPFGIRSCGSCLQEVSQKVPDTSRCYSLIARVDELTFGTGI